MSKFQVGDYVRILLREDVDNPDKDPVYTSEMQDYEDCVAIVKHVNGGGDLTLEVNGLAVWYDWSEDWLEMEGLTYSAASTAVYDLTELREDVLYPQCHSEGETHDIENIMDITRNMCRG